jgi:rhamnogalacturonyl hydrolase YesR
MRRIKILIAIFSFTAALLMPQNIFSQNIPSQATLDAMVLANRNFVARNSSILGNGWSQGLYFEGLMAMYKLNSDPSYLDYALQWGASHRFSFANGTKTRNAADLCSGQTYIDLYLTDRYKEERIKPVRANFDGLLASGKIDEWSRISDLQMVMPVFARLGQIYHNEKYYDMMHASYLNAKTKQGTAGLYNPVDHLWWRDKDFVEPYKEPNGKNCYWAKDNGLIIAALVRTLDFMPQNGDYKKEYHKTLKDMFEALVPLQRADGYWNVSLLDPDHFTGKDISGTSLIVYGMAWGINNGIISKKDYLPVVTKAWKSLMNDYPESKSAGYDVEPDPEEAVLGTYLLAGSEMYKLSKSMEPKEKPVKAPKVKEDKASKNKKDNDKVAGKDDNKKVKGKEDKHKKDTEKENSSK